MLSGPVRLEKLRLRKRRRILGLLSSPPMHEPDRRGSCCTDSFCFDAAASTRLEDPPMDISVLRPREARRHPRARPSDLRPSPRTVQHPRRVPSVNRSHFLLLVALFQRLHRDRRPRVLHTRRLRLARRRCAGRRRRAADPGSQGAGAGLLAARRTPASNAANPHPPAPRPPAEPSPSFRF